MIGVLLLSAAVLYWLAIWVVSRLIADHQTRRALVKTMAVWLIAYAIVIQVWQAIGVWLVHGSPVPELFGYGATEFGRGIEWLRVTFALIQIAAPIGLAFYAPRVVTGRSLVLALLFMFLTIGVIEFSNACSLGETMFFSTSC